VIKTVGHVVCDELPAGRNPAHMHACDSGHDDDDVDNGAAQAAREVRGNAENFLVSFFLCQSVYIIIMHGNEQNGNLV
jgi:hypothetical protein